MNVSRIVVFCLLDKGPKCRQAIFNIVMTLIELESQMGCNDTVFSAVASRLQGPRFNPVVVCCLFEVGTLSQ